MSEYVQRSVDEEKKSFEIDGTTKHIIIQGVSTRHDLDADAVEC